MQLRLLLLTIAWAWQEPFGQHERKHCSREPSKKARMRLLTSKAAAGLSHSKLGTEENRFALEHLYGDEKRKGSIDAAGCQDEQNVVPMKSPSNDLLTDET